MKKLLLGFMSISLLVLLFSLTAGFTEVTQESSDLEIVENEHFPVTFNQFKSEELINNVDLNKSNKKTFKVKFSTEASESPDTAYLSGKGHLKMGAKNYNFTIEKQIVYKEILSTGETFYWGPLETSIKNKKNISTSIILSIGYFPESKQLLSNVTIGDLNQGAVVIKFGNINFTGALAEEIQEKIISRGND